MSIIRALIRWPCLHGSMYLVTATLSCHHSIVPLCLRAATSPEDRATEPPSHLATCHTVTVPPATTSHRGTCHTVSPCQLTHRFTASPATLSHCPTVPPATTMPQPCHRDIWCATVAACHRRTDTSHLTHQHTSVHPRTWHTSPRTWHFSIIAPYLPALSVFFSQYGLLLKLAMSSLMGFSEGLWVF